MFSTIYLFNRTKYGYHNKLYTLKRTLDNMIEQSSEWTKRERVNFDRTNGLMTTIVLNTSSTAHNDNYYEFNYLYDVTRDQRWFITGVTETRNGQFQYTLVRDVFSDYYGSISDVPTIINRANQITAVTQQAQYKKTLSLSQIKTGEITLNDGIGNGWIYVYFAKNAALTTGGSYFSVAKVNNAINDTVVLTDAMKSDLGKKLIVLDDMMIDFYLWLQPDINENRAYYLYEGDYTKLVPYVSSKSLVGDKPFFDVLEEDPTTDEMMYYIRRHYSEYKSYAISQNQYVVNEQYNALVGLNGQVIKDSEGKLYTVRVDDVAGSEHDVYASDEMVIAFAEEFDLNPISKKVGDDRKALTFKLKGKCYNISFTEVKDTSAYYVSIPVSWINNRAVTTNCLYDIMAFPVECTVLTKSLKSDSSVYTSQVINTTYADTINFVQALKTSMGDAVYDIQWLPYGPIEPTTSSSTYYDLTNKLSGDKKTNWSNNTSTITTTEGDETTTSRSEKVIHDSTVVNQVICGCVSTETGTVQANVAWINLTSNVISRRVNMDIISVGNDYMANRLANEEYMYRLCGPNWNSTFEFSAVNNGGFKGYYIDVTLKPYNPFVRVQPIFGNMYGSNFNDPRGLILKGDFSIEQCTEAFRNYQLNNRNYELVFNRQIQSLDLKNSVANRMDELNSGLDTLSIFTGGLKGASQGALSGATTGSIGGAAIGAGIGATAATIGGIADLTLNDSIRDMNRSIRMDARDASIKQYQYQLGNIQALPNTLSRSSSFDAMYRIYPVLEIYSCSESEKLQTELAVKWCGIDINQMSTIDEQYENGTGELYIAATLLRTEGLNDQEFGALSQLLADGIYIERS